MNRSLHCLISIIVLRNFTLGLEGIRHLIVKVAADMKAKKMLRVRTFQPRCILCALFMDAGMLK